MPFILKIHKSGDGTIAAICDSEILGMTFEDDDDILDVDQYFFSGDEADIEAIREAIENATTANIIGNEITAQLLEKGIIKESGIKEIQGIRYAHVYKI